MLCGSHQAVEKEKRKRADEEMGDAMKSLENRALDSKQDMDILAALEEMRSMKVLQTCFAGMICSITASGSPFVLLFCSLGMQL